MKKLRILRPSKQGLGDFFFIRETEAGPPSIGDFELPARRRTCIRERQQIMQNLSFWKQIRQESYIFYQNEAPTEQNNIAT